LFAFSWLSSTGLAQAESRFPERFGPFVLLRELGVGGMGAAYLASHAESGTLLVVKRVHPELQRDPVIFKRFVHEAEVATHVRHPNVAALVAMGTIDNEPFLATEYVFGIQVSQIVDRVESSQIDPIPLPIGLFLACELAAGVEAIHGAVHRETGEHLGLIHRDIGARNTLIGFDGQIRIIDLGLGKSLLADWQTASEVLAGSPDYMPPEQAMGARVDARADVYSAAVTIWEILAGKKRVREEGVLARISRAIEAQAEPLVPFRPEASKNLESILREAMSADPDQRMSTAQMLHRALREELARQSKNVTRRDVAAWLDSACATVIAREKRILSDARGLMSGAVAPDVAKTLMLVGDAEQSFNKSSPFNVYGDNDASIPSQREIVTMSGEVTVKPFEKPPAPVTDEGRSRWRAVLERRGEMLSAGVLALFTLAILSAIFARPRAADVQVTALPESSAPPGATAKEPAGGPKVEGEPGETARGVGAVEPEGADHELEENAPNTHRKVDRDFRDEAPGRGSSEPVHLSPEIESRKNELVRRIRHLRRMRFDVGFQRKVTALSTRLSRARSMKTLDELESSIVRLEHGT
jgi:serine/threonine-protein kinase